MRDPRYPVSQDVSMLPLMASLHRASKATDRVFTEFLEARGLTPSQFDVLATLGDTEGLAFKDLSGQSFVSGGTLTPVLNRLEAKGLVARCKHPSDNRQVIIKLTPAGQALYEETFLPMVDHVQARLAGLGANQQAQLIELLDKLADLFDPNA